MDRCFLEGAIFATTHSFMMICCSRGPPPFCVRNITVCYVLAQNNKDYRRLQQFAMLALPNIVITTFCVRLLVIRGNASQIFNPRNVKKGAPNAVIFDPKRRLLRASFHGYRLPPLPPVQVKFHNLLYSIFYVPSSTDRPTTSNEHTQRPGQATSKCMDKKN